MSRLFLPLVLLAACTDGGESGNSDDTGEAGALSDIPADITAGWDVESVGCPEGATAYWYFEGEITADAEIHGTEAWYWFFPDEGDATDCVDRFALDGVEEPTPVPDDPCLSCDRDFTAHYVLDSTECNWDGYESLLDNDDTDRIEEEEYVLALMFDTDPLGGEEGEVNVWTFFRDDTSNRTYNDHGINDGFFVPDDGMDGPGKMTWVARDGLCIEVRDG
jgi:hypothetical protein